jgi:predicted ATP-grasp superfamily ATP-dependent carboligase
MRLFLYEYFCATAGATPLRQEGYAMLSAVAQDFSAIPGVTTLCLLADNGSSHVGHVCRQLEGPEEQGFRACAAQADATLVIAPEFDDLLAERSHWAREEGSELLGSPPDVVRSTADKVHLARMLGESLVATPPVSLPDRNGNWSGAPRLFPLLIKLRYGAGCRGIRYVTDEAHFAKQWRQALNEAPPESWFVQLLVQGQPASAAFLIGSKEVVSLPPGFQHVTRREEGLCYQGGSLPLPPGLRVRAVDLAGRALRCFPGLRGFVGVDLILGDDAAGAQDRVIEINPRLTTSYVGLRRLCNGNLAKAWWSLHRGERMDPFSWKDGPVSFQTCGRLE